MTDPVWKMIYLARRNPQLRAEDFPQAWREHSALGRQCKNVATRVKSVAQCSRVLAPAGLAGTDQTYDGVNLLVLSDRESAAAIWSDPETLAVMRPDEPRVFSTYVRHFSLVCREHVLRDQARSAVVLHGFLRRRAGLAADDFYLAWSAANPARALVQGPLGCAGRVAVNEVVDTPPPGYEFDVIVEWWFASVEEVAQAFGSRAVHDQLPDALTRLLEVNGSVFLLTQVTHSRP
jgi:hypothetical protein